MIIDRPVTRPAASQEKLAVLDLQAKGDLSPEVASILTARPR